MFAAEDYKDIFRIRPGTKQCPDDGSNLENGNISVHHKDGRIKKLPVRICVRCGKYYTPGFGDSIRIPDFAVRVHGPDAERNDSEKRESTVSSVSVSTSLQERLNGVRYDTILDAQMLEILFEENGIPAYSRVPVFVADIIADTNHNVRAMRIRPVMQVDTVLRYAGEEISAYVRNTVRISQGTVICVLARGAMNELFNLLPAYVCSFQSLGLTCESNRAEVLEAAAMTAPFDQYFPKGEFTWEQYIQMQLSYAHAEAESRELEGIRTQLHTANGELETTRTLIAAENERLEAVRIQRETAEAELNGYRQRIEQSQEMLERYNNDMRFCDIPARQSDMRIAQGSITLGGIRTHLKYDYSDDVLLQFLMGINTSQIIMLCGKPGMGKTTFVTTVAKAMGAKCTVVQVQNNWSDKSDVLGYYDPLNQVYQTTEFLEALRAAKADEVRYHASSPLHIICLDEMNLAHIEYYFATFLSLLQLDPEDRIIKLLPPSAKVPEDVATCYADFILPRNVCFVGTMNSDATTTLLSPKVIDRCLFIEFRQIQQKNDSRTWQATQEYYPIGSFISDTESFDEEFERSLPEIFRMENYRFQVNALRMYRIYRRLGLVNIVQFCDYLILSKILPRLNTESEFMRFQGAGYERSEKRFADTEPQYEGQWSFWS